MSDVTKMVRKPIPGYEAVYDVSENGVVWRLWKSGDRPLKNSVSARGYERVQLSTRNRTADYFVHRLVAAAFLGPRPHDMCVNHKDGNKRNNHWTNLEYVTTKDNELHAVTNGLKACGERHGRSRFTRDQVVLIRQRAIAGESKYELAMEFDTSWNQINNIVSGRTWRRT